MDNVSAGLFLDMGLGKTVVTLTAMADLLLMGEVQRILVVAPLRVANTVWAQEALKWEHTHWLVTSTVTGSQMQRELALCKEAHVYIINRENIKWLCELYDYNLPFDMLVIDELSSFKSHDSQRFKALKKAKPSFKRVVGLTGTPHGNSYLGLWAQIYLLDGGVRLYPFITRYRERYFMQNRVGTSEHALQYILRPGAERAINEKIGDICLAMKTEDYLQLPSFVVHDEWVDMPENMFKLYKAFERDRLIELADDTVEAESKVSLVGKLLQYSNGAIYTDDGETSTRTFANVHNAKIERMLSLVEQADGEPVLIGYTFKHDKARIIAALKHEMPKLRIGVLDNDAMVDKWNNKEIDVLLAHPASAGHGLNLQFGGSIIIWFGLPWSLEMYMQFNKRLHRNGITKPVMCYRIMCNNTYDDVVRVSLSDNMTHHDALMEYLKRNDMVDEVMEEVKTRLNKKEKRYA